MLDVRYGENLIWPTRPIFENARPTFSRSCKKHVIRNTQPTLTIKWRHRNTCVKVASYTLVSEVKFCCKRLWLVSKLFISSRSIVNGSSFCFDAVATVTWRFDDVVSNAWKIDPCADESTHKYHIIFYKHINIKEPLFTLIRFYLRVMKDVLTLVNIFGFFKV